MGDQMFMPLQTDGFARRGGCAGTSDRCTQGQDRLLLGKSPLTEHRLV